MTTESQQPIQTKKRWKLIVKILGALVLFQLLADAGHAWFVSSTVAKWEANTERESNGVLKGCDAYLLPATQEIAAGDEETPARKTAGEDSASVLTAILMLHGINASPRHYDLLAPALAEQGFACRVMRLPGFAEPLAEYRKGKASDWVEAVHEELTALRKDYDRVGIVAHSLGGATAISALLDHPEDADFAVLLAPAVAVSNSRSPLLSTRSWHEISQRLLLFTHTVQSPYPIDCRKEGKIDHPGRTPFTPAVVITELFKLIDRNAGKAAEWQVPVTMVLSTTDPIVSTPAAEKYFEAMPLEDKSLVLLENSGHAIPVDQEWESVVEAIVERASVE